MHVEIASLLPDLAVIISITCTGLSSQLPCRLQGTAHFIIATCFCSVGNLWFKSIFWQRLLAYTLQITAADQRTLKNCELAEDTQSFQLVCPEILQAMSTIFLVHLFFSILETLAIVPPYVQIFPKRMIHSNLVCNQAPNYGAVYLTRIESSSHSVHDT